MASAMDVCPGLQAGVVSEMDTHPGDKTSVASEMDAGTFAAACKGRAPSLDQEGKYRGQWVAALAHCVTGCASARKSEGAAPPGGHTGCFILTPELSALLSLPSATCDAPMPRGGIPLLSMVVQHDAYCCRW